MKLKNNLFNLKTVNLKIKVHLNTVNKNNYKIIYLSTVNKNYYIIKIL